MRLNKTEEIIFKALSREQIGELFKCLLKFKEGEEVKIQNPAMAIIFEVLKEAQIQEDSISKVRSEAGRSGGLKKTSKCKQTEAKPSKTKQNQAKPSKACNTQKDNDLQPISAENGKTAENPPYNPPITTTNIQDNINTVKEEEREVKKEIYKERKQEKEESRTIAQIIDDVFIPYRKDIGKKVKTPYCRRLLIKRLEDYSGGDIATASAIVEQSIANGWLGLFQLKQERPMKRDNAPIGMIYDNKPITDEGCACFGRELGKP